MTTPLPNMRADYGLPPDVTYFNCAYLSPLHRRVEEAGIRGLHRKARPWEVKPQHFFDEAQELRQLFGTLIGCSGEHIALVPAVSYGIAIAAANLPLAPGQQVLVLAEQFPSNYYAWKVKADQAGGSICIVPRPEDGNWTHAILQHLNSNIGIVAIPNAHWTDGTLVDLEQVSAECHKRKIPLVLDVTQSLGAMPLNVASIKPAFLVSAGYKWLQGPYGLGYLYVAPEYQNGTPLEYNWITRAGSEDFARLVDYEENLIQGATRFDMGERSNFHLAPMALAACQQLLDWGVARISATLESYNNLLIEGAARLGFQVAPKTFRSPHLLGLRYPGKLPTSLAGALAERQIYVSVRGDAVRVSPHLYNDEQDLARFLTGLKECL